LQLAAAYTSMKTQPSKSPKKGWNGLARAKQTLKPPKKRVSSPVGHFGFPVHTAQSCKKVKPQFLL